MICLLANVGPTTNFMIYTSGDVQPTCLTSASQMGTNCLAGNLGHVYLGFSKLHASTVPSMLNPETGAITTQYHVVFDNWFSTVSSVAATLPNLGVVNGRKSSVTASTNILSTILMTCLAVPTNHGTCQPNTRSRTSINSYRLHLRMRGRKHHQLLFKLKRKLQGVQEYQGEHQALVQPKNFPILLLHQWLSLRPYNDKTFPLSQ
jgi:hypothetical protein